MPKISNWNPKKGNNYYYQDNMIKNFFNHSGTGVYVHKYIGPASGGDETTIDDLLFLENRSRKYSDEIYEMRGSYQPQSSDFDLSQFGIFISNDTIFIMFHYNDMLDIIGRKLMSGDVLELPHLTDPDTLDPDAPVTHRFYTVVEGAHASEGYGTGWYSHIWRIKAKQTLNAPEYAGITGGDSPEGQGNFLDGLGTASNSSSFSRPGTIIDKDGNEVGSICAGGSIEGGSGGNNGNGSIDVGGLISCGGGGGTIEKEQEITDGIIAEAYADVRFDPKQFDAAHLWVREDVVTGDFDMFPWSGDGIPPNGMALSGMGEEFDPSANDGDFFLRTDFEPDRLFRKEGTIWRFIEADFRKSWTAYNKILDTFIDNKSTDIMSDGTTQDTKKAISKVVKPKINLHQSKEDEIKNSNNGKLK
jgi:hypothetical protein